MIHRVKIKPSQWSLDVYTGKIKDLPSVFQKRYGGKKSEFLDLTEGSECFVTTCRSTKSSKAKGETRIVIVIPKESYKDYILVHELMHVLWYYSKYCGVEMNHGSQEWQAVLTEYLFRKIKKIYKK